MGAGLAVVSGLLGLAADDGVSSAVEAAELALGLGLGLGLEVAGLELVEPVAVGDGAGVPGLHAASEPLIPMTAARASPVPHWRRLDVVR